MLVPWQTTFSGCEDARRARVTGRSGAAGIGVARGDARRGPARELDRVDAGQLAFAGPFIEPLRELLPAHRDLGPGVGQREARIMARPEQLQRRALLRP